MYAEGRWLVSLDIVEVDYKRDYLVALVDAAGNVFTSRQRFAKLVACSAFIEATRKALRAGATPVGNAKWIATAGPRAERARVAQEERRAAESLAWSAERDCSMRPEAAE